MENELHVRKIGRESQHTFPVRISPLSATNKQYINKIRINHSKLPSQFFSNPRSMPDLQVSTRAPSLEIWKKRKQKTATLCSEENSSKEVTRSLKNYNSVERRRSKEQQRKINELFIESDELGVTFSRLPIKRVHNNIQKVKEFERAYFKKISTQPYEQLQEHFKDKKEQSYGLTIKIDNLVKARQGISIRRNNHPLTTLREIKRQCI